MTKPRDIPGAGPVTQGYPSRICGTCAFGEGDGRTLFCVVHARAVNTSETCKHWEGD